MPVGRYFLFVGGISRLMLLPPATVGRQCRPRDQQDRGADPFRPKIAGTCSLRHSLPTIVPPAAATQIAAGSGRGRRRPGAGARLRCEELYPKHNT